MRAIAAASRVALGPIVALARRSPASSPRRATAQATDSPFTSFVAALEAAAAMLEMERPTAAIFSLESTASCHAVLVAIWARRGTTINALRVPAGQQGELEVTALLACRVQLDAIA